MNALSKADIVKTLCDKYRLLKPDAQDFVELFFEEIRLILESGHNLKISGFGNFILRDKSTRPGRNPKTKEEVLIEARRVVVFRPGKKLVGFLQEG